MNEQIKKNIPIELIDLRQQIDQVNQDIIRLIAKRMDLVRGVARVKKETGFSQFDPDREAKIITTVKQLAVDNNLDPDLTEVIFCKLIEGAHEEESKIIN